MTSPINFSITHEFATFEWNVDIFANKEDGKFFVSPTFSFADATWHLQLAGKFLSSPESTSLILMRNERRHCSLTYTFGLKKQDGSIEVLEKGKMKNDQKRIEHRFIKLSEVLQQKSELAPTGIVAISCSLRLETSKSSEPGLLEKLKKVKRLETLSKNFKDLFNGKLACDIILCVKDKEYKAHKSILIARSEVFAAMFQHETSEKQTSTIIIPDCDPESFAEFLEFLYCGRLDNLSNHSAVHLFQTSEKYGMLELKKFCCEHLIENLSLENWYDVLVIADLYNEEALFIAVQDFFNKNLNLFFRSSEFQQLIKNNNVLANKLLKGMPRVRVAQS